MVARRMTWSASVPALCLALCLMLPGMARPALAMDDADHAPLALAEAAAVEPAAAPVAPALAVEHARVDPEAVTLQAIAAPAEIPAPAALAAAPGAAAADFVLPDEEVPDVASITASLQQPQARLAPEAMPADPAPAAETSAAAPPAAAPLAAAPFAAATPGDALPATIPAAEPVPAAAPPALDAPAMAPPALAAAPAAPLAPLLAARLPDAGRQPFLREADQRELVAFYEARQHEPLWFSASGLTEAGARLQATLALAAEDGLRPADYALPRLIEPRPDDLAAADIRLSALAVRYARDARGGRIDPRRLSALITPTLELPSAATVLTALAAAPDAGAAISAFQPRHPGYLALKAKLAELQAALPTPVPEVRIPAGPAIRIGMRDDRIALIRARFGFAPDETRQHDRTLATVVASFQRDNGLPANGVINRATLDALNGNATPALVSDIIASMERWRWLPADLGDEHLIVNVPEYLVRKVENGAVVHQSRVIVGKTERPTPIFSDLMDHLVLNPSWHVPPTILRKDILPKLATDPGYAERRGFEVVRRGNQISVRQPPGPTNALGNIKFMFPNAHAVYLHDTPTRSLFGASRRAYSSGCVRVENPMKLAELVLGGAQNGWSERRLQGMVGSGERTIRLSRKLPIHIVYMTHVISEDGQLNTFDDIYGFHRRTREALGL